MLYLALDILQVNFQVMKNSWFWWVDLILTSLVTGILVTTNCQTKHQIKPETTKAVISQ